MNEKEIRERALALPGIKSLNNMQERALKCNASQLILIAPTGSGKTLAFGLRILKWLSEPRKSVQALVIAPSRELVMQTASVMRQLARGYKTTALYGGHSMADEKASLTPEPEIIIATPGRFLDHLQRGNLAIGEGLEAFVLDEYDKSLQLGFEADMKKIVRRVGKARSMTLTSATVMEEIPEYLGLSHAEVIETETARPVESRLEIVEVESFTRDKLDALEALLLTFPASERTIVFVNHRESAERVWKRLRESGSSAGLYHGALEQQQRETAIDLFANGTTPILVATDLAARGLDITGVANVVHYHLPVDEAAWTHRNGRTARVDAEGRVFLITSEADNRPPYINPSSALQPHPGDKKPEASPMGTLYLNAGKKEKISKGDILGFILANSSLSAAEIGRISVHDHYALVAVPRESMRQLAVALNAVKIKGKKVKVSQVKA